MQRSPVHHSGLAIVSTVLGSIPWCCILPASLSFLSLTGTIVGQVWMTKLSWVLLPVSVALLGRAFWLMYVRHQGVRWARWMTWTAAVVSVGFWTPRLWLWISL